MAGPFGVLRVPVQRVEGSFIRSISGAIVTVYDTLPDNTSPVTEAGSVNVLATKSVLYADRLALTSKNNPMTSDNKGVVECYVAPGNYHLHVVAPDGQEFGLPWLAHFGEGGQSESGSMVVTAFGAKGDGVTDDAGAIMAAHDALPADGGELIFGPGKFLHKSQLLFTKTVRIAGAGFSSNEFTNAPTELTKHSSVSTTGVVFAGQASRVSGVIFKGQVGNSGDGVQIKAPRVVMRECSVFKMGGNGIRIGDSVSGAANCNVFQLHSVFCRENGGDGLVLHSDDTSVQMDCNGGIVIGGGFQSNGGHGIHIKNAALNTFVGCHVETNDGYGWYLEMRAQQNVMIGGDTEGNVLGGVIIAEGLAVDNLFIMVPNIPSQPTPFTDHNDARTMRINPLNTGTGGWQLPGSTGDVLHTKPGRGSFSGSNRQSISLWGDLNERIRFGWHVSGAETGLVSAQVVADVNTLFLRSRDTAAGKVNIQAGSAQAGQILLDPQNVRIEISESLQMNRAGGYIEQLEGSDPSAPGTNKSRLFTRDNGAGKTQLCVRFNTGAVQVIATEP